VQAALLAEREEGRLAINMEKHALEEMRTARIKVGSITVGGHDPHSKYGVQSHQKHAAAAG
jgi:hypothetical protein